jgi:hypothetical protein
MEVLYNKDNTRTIKRFYDVEWFSNKEFEVAREYNAKLVQNSEIEEVRDKTYSMTGYNRVTYRFEIGISDYYMIERFDGNRLLFNSYTLGETIENLNDKEVTIVNGYIKEWEELRGRKTFIISDAHEISKEDYIPKVNGMLRYMYNSSASNFKKAATCVDCEEAELVVGKVGMTESEYRGLLPKLKMIGVPYMLVDINTVATLKRDSNDIVIYTMRKNIEY